MAARVRGGGTSGGALPGRARSPQGGGEGRAAVSGLRPRSDVAIPGPAPARPGNTLCPAAKSEGGVFSFARQRAISPHCPSMKIVLAYSGGLDTSVIVKWLRETHDAEIITFAADIGQEEELNGLPRKARMTGASKHHTLDR